MRHIEFSFHANYEPDINSKIKMIKAYRAATGVTLRDAKELVEQAILTDARVRMTEQQFGRFLATIMVSGIILNCPGEHTYYITQVVSLEAGRPDGLYDLTG